MVKIILCSPKSWRVNVNRSAYTFSHLKIKTASWKRRWTTIKWFEVLPEYFNSYITSWTFIIITSSSDSTHYGSCWVYVQYFPTAPNMKLWIWVLETSLIFNMQDRDKRKSSSHLYNFYIKLLMNLSRVYICVWRSSFLGNLKTINNKEILLNYRWFIDRLRGNN